MLLAANLPIIAATTQNTFSVTASTVGKCTISANELAFNTTIPTPIVIIPEATGTLVIFCSSDGQGEVSLSQGAGIGASCADRRMTPAAGGEGFLKYQLYRDQGGSTIFGDGVTCGATQLFDTSTGYVYVYGRLIAPQSPAPGLYSDTITATITF